VSTTLPHTDSPTVDPALRRAEGAARWALALQAAALVAVDPVGLGGAALRAPAGPLRDAWLALLRRLLPDVPWRRVPLHISDERLLGGIDLAATLQAGRPVAQRGLMAEADGGVVQLAMAERMPLSALAHWSGAIDQAALRVEREGLSLTVPTRFGVIALDEGIDDDERCPAALLDRLAFHLDLSEVAPGDADGADGVLPWSADDVSAARARLAGVADDGQALEALCTAAVALGVDSLRAPLQALRTARAAAALAGRGAVDETDVALAARLVLAPRATRLPASAEQAPSPDEPAPPPAEAAPPPAPPPPPDDPAAEATPPPEGDEEMPPLPDLDTLQDIVLDAARAAMPAGLLARLRAGLPPAGSPPAATAGGRAGAWQPGRARGRPAGVRRGLPRAGLRLNLIETLRAAAPWQLVRRMARTAPAGGPATERRIEVRADDFHTTRTQQRRETTTVFVVDASGSAALHRLAEAKGAVELLLADCYVRRDRVAVLGFRGRGAELLLPPTRSLVRAKRSLAGLPGGGGTPLASAIDAAADLADGLRRRGDTTVVVLLTDGRANIARDGQPGRERAAQDALQASRRLRAAGVPVLLVDTSAQPGEPARRLAEALGAQYLPLPYAGSAQLSQAIQLSARNLSR
jgi:magnesium chelatase subunit D